MYGILGIHKPVGMSSFDVIRIIKQKTGLKKLGHGGTLDPLAEGVLPILIGDAAAYFDALLQAPKTYEAVIQLGSFTETDDSEGSIIESFSVPPLHLEDILSLSSQLTGEIIQIPPKYSALKIDGKRAYDLARAGKEVKLQPRKVTVYSWSNISLTENTITASIKCSSGTYIRSLARTLGEKLSCGAHLSGLKRTRCGGIALENCLKLKDLEKNWQDLLISPDQALDFMPKFIWNSSLTHLIYGKPLNLGSYTLEEGVYGPSHLYTLVYDKKILGLVCIKDGKISYQKNLSRLYDE